MDLQSGIPASPPRVLLSNQDSSPLIRLPREIKDQIYDYVFTSKTVHVHDFFGETSDLEKKTNGQLYHHSCHRRVEEALERKAQEALDDSVVETISSNIHGFCCWYPPCKRHLVPSSVRYVDLLLTCRQLNHGATKVLYANTMFSFESWDVINRFISRTPSSSLLNVRSIRIEVQTGSTFHYVLWTQTLHELSITMRGLCYLHLEIKHRTPRWQRGRTLPLSLDNENGLMKGLMYLSNVPLREVIVLISDPLFGPDFAYPSWGGERENGTDSFGRLPLAWKEQFSRDIRKRLLDQSNDLREANES